MFHYYKKRLSCRWSCLLKYKLKMFDIAALKPEITWGNIFILITNISDNVVFCCNRMTTKYQCYLVVEETKCHVEDKSSREILLCICFILIFLSFETTTNCVIGMNIFKPKYFMIYESTNALRNGLKSIRIIFIRYMLVSSVTLKLNYYT